MAPMRVGIGHHAECNGLVRRGCSAKWCCRPRGCVLGRKPGRAKSASSSPGVARMGSEPPQWKRLCGQQPGVRGGQAEMAHSMWEQCAEVSNKHLAENLASGFTLGRQSGRRQIAPPASGFTSRRSDGGTLSGMDEALHDDEAAAGKRADDGALYDIKIYPGQRLLDESWCRRFAYGPRRELVAGSMISRKSLSERIELPARAACRLRRG